MSGLLRFGVFELDPDKAELRKAGTAVKLTNLPCQVLACLVRNAGSVVTREELQRTIWGDGTYVDFDRNLNVAVAQIRSALNDDAESPRFIQTVPRRGYKFVAPVERTVPAAEPEPSARGRGLLMAGVAVAAAIAGALLMAWIRPEAPSAPSRPLIALLPFEPVNGADEAMLDGLTDELITQLGSLHPDRLGVIARSSVMRYKGRRAPIDQVRRDLRVDYVLEATARRENGLVRFTVRLISAADQAQIWTSVFEQETGAGLAAEEAIAARIAAGITSQLFPDRAAVAPLPSTRSAEAWTEYRQGRALQHQGGRAATARAAARFEQALQADPRFAAAAAALAESNIALARMGGRPADLYPKAAEAARRAIALDADNSEALNALANTLFWYEWKWRDAEAHFRRAIRANPSNAAAHHDLAWLLVAARRTEEGLVSLRRALELDPLSRRVNIDAGWLLLQAHRYAEAASQARRALEIEPGLREAIFCLSRALVFERRYSEARAELLKLTVDPALHRELEALAPEAALRRYYRALAERTPSPSESSRVWAWLGEREKAFATLETALAERNSVIPLLRTEPSFEAISDDPRFADLLRRAEPR